MRTKADAKTAATASVIGKSDASLGVGIKHTFKIEAFDRHGNLKWRDEFDNLVVNEGLDDYLDKYYKGSSYTASHFVGLTDGTPTFAAGDTMGSHAGWVEVTDYDEAARVSYSPGTVSSQSVDNSGTPAAFTINATVTVGGAFITTDNTKGGTAGILVGGNAFSGGDRSLQSGDTLNVTVTASLTSS